MTCPTAPVQVMTRSLSASDVGQLGPRAGHCRTSRRRGARRARAVRLTMVSDSTPWRRAVAAARPLIPPAPTTAARDAVERPEDGGRLLERDLHERDAVLVDVGLGVGTLADPQGALEERVERLAHLPAALGPGERVAHLAEDLGLADGHRVEPAGDGEGVGDGARRRSGRRGGRREPRHGRPARPPGPRREVGDRRSARLLDAGRDRERLADGGDGGVEGGHRGIHLEAVARARARRPRWPWPRRGPRPRWPRLGRGARRAPRAPTAVPCGGTGR